MREAHVRTSGFTMVEMVFGMLMLGVVLLSFMGIFMLFQRSSAQTRQAADAQQNARMALDYITEHLRQAGAGTDYIRGQRFIVHAGPYQVAMNADIDNGQNIGGDAPLEALDLNFAPNTVPPGGTTIYQPPRDFDAGAETVVLTLDSSSDGVVNAGDRGDDAEEGGHNDNVYLLKRVTYGSNGVDANEVRTTNLALVRGPEAYPDGTRPEPLFQYYIDHDDDPGTAVVLWGDGDGDGHLNDAEINGVTPIPDARLAQIRRIEVTVVSESDEYNQRYEQTGGFLAVEMTSEVYVRNALRSRSTIYGRVYQDANADGVMDPGENGIPDVTITMVGFNRTAKTNGSGYYFVPVDAGAYAVRELDPAGYTSTTPNLVSVNVPSGQAVAVNFGDRSTGPMGFIRGKVFDDVDQDGVLGANERGIKDVTVTLDSGEKVLTDLNGDYSFMVAVGAYDVVEVDPDGFGSTTPNNMRAELLAHGDTVVVNFGDALKPKNGTIEGYVFEDDNQDGLRDNFEGGLASVTLTLSTGDSTITDGSGYYQFSLPPGVYDVVERDPPGYTSSTYNTVTGIHIAPDTVVTVNFGDFLLQKNDFIEINIGSTARALSLDAVDLEEDRNGDVDLIVGTPFSKGAGNMLVFHNNRRNAKTAITALFDATPTYYRNAGHNVNTLRAFDFTNDGRPDVYTGLDYAAGNNLQIWFGDKNGFLSNAPDHTYTSAQLTFVLSSARGDFNEDGRQDVVLGLRNGSGTFTGALQIFHGDGRGAFTDGMFINEAGALAPTKLGEIWAIDAADIDHDGDDDIVVGSHDNLYAGFIDVYLNIGGHSGKFKWGARYPVPGAVNAIELVDMAEDSYRDIDILAGISTSTNAGMLLMYSNTYGVFGVPDAKQPIGSDVTYNRPNDALSTGGEVLSLDADYVNPDIFPDIFVGTRSGLYTGDVYYVVSFGALPSDGLRLNTTSVGEVVTMRVGDFNLDGGRDVALGTRTSSSQGKLLIFFYDGP